MYIESLNKMIEYIENHLDTNIDYKELGKIIGVNDFILQRIFTFLTNMTLTEYIKKRRLSKAFEELNTTNTKIIDIAIKYQYNSQASFTRAFKNLFGITPKACRTSTKKHKIFPIIEFDKNNSIDLDFDYEIKSIEPIKIYCFSVSSEDRQNYLYLIRKLYFKMRKNGYHKKFEEHGMYGISTKVEDTYHYFVGSKHKDENLETHTIKGGKYAVFQLNSREQKDIVKIQENIYRRWFPSTNYSLCPNDDFELYEKDHCYIYVSIK